MRDVTGIPMFFVVGRERSGTTLLQLLCDNHPNIIIPTESPFIKHLYKKYVNRTHWCQKDLLNFYNDLMEEPFITLWNINRERLKAELLSSDPSVSFASLCKIIYFHSMSSNGKADVRLIGDKN